MSKMRLGIDFDGVIHDYKEGWKGGEIYGNVVPGFFEWVARARETFELVIYSSRSKVSEGRTAMINWLGDQLRKNYGDDPSWWPVSLNDFEFAAEKPALFLTIDDRCVRFDGDWAAAELQPEVLAGYKPWNKK